MFKCSFDKYFFYPDWVFSLWRAAQIHKWEISHTKGKKNRERLSGYSNQIFVLVDYSEL